MTSRSVFFNS